jgi:hypothetical protein
VALFSHSNLGIRKIVRVKYILVNSTFRDNYSDDKEWTSFSELGTEVSEDYLRTEIKLHKRNYYFYG